MAESCKYGNQKKPKLRGREIFLDESLQRNLRLVDKKNYIVRFVDFKLSHCYLNFYEILRTVISSLSCVLPKNRRR